MKYNKNLKIAKVMREDAEKQFLNITDDTRIQGLYLFNKAILSELNIHTESYRYKVAYVSTLIAADLLLMDNDDIENLVNVRYEYQQDHNIEFNDGKVVINNNINNPKEVKDKAMQVGIGIPSPITGKQD